MPKKRAKHRKGEKTETYSHKGGKTLLHLKNGKNSSEKKSVSMGAKRGRGNHHKT